MAITTTKTTGAQEWIARPNRSLTPTSRRALIGLIITASTLISGGFLLAGAWMVLPFAGLEIAILFLALRAVERSDKAFESIRLEGEQLIITCQLSDRESHQSFHAGWARISLEGDDACDPLLCIRSHGHSAWVGRLMTLAQRRQLALELKHRLHP